MPAKGPETRDLDARAIARVALGTMLVMAAVFAGLAGLQGRFRHLAGLPAPSPGTPPIWVHERDLKDRYLAARRHDLATYRWLDRNAGMRRERHGQFHIVGPVHGTTHPLGLHRLPIALQPTGFTKIAPDQLLVCRKLLRRHPAVAVRIQLE